MACPAFRNLHVGRTDRCERYLLIAGAAVDRAGQQGQLSFLGAGKNELSRVHKPRFAVGMLLDPKKCAPRIL